MMPRLIAILLVTQLGYTSHAQRFLDGSFEAFDLEPDGFTFDFSESVWSGGANFSVAEPFMDPTSLPPRVTAATQPAHRGNQYATAASSGFLTQRVTLLNTSIGLFDTVELSVWAAGASGVLNGQLPITDSQFRFVYNQLPISDEVHTITPGQSFTRYAETFEIPLRGDSEFPRIGIQQISNTSTAIAHYDNFSLSENDGPDGTLSVTYKTPSGSGSLDGISLPDEVTATFTIDNLVPGRSFIRRGSISDFELDLPGVETTASELRNFTLLLDSDGQPTNLTWRAPEVATDDPLLAELDLLNNDFQLTFRGTNTATDEPFEYFYSESTFELRPPTLPGDFDGDGAVTEADLSVWQTNYGAGDATALHDAGNGDDVVDAADYTVWRDAFDQALAAPVPEPATGWITAAAIAVLGRYRATRPA